MADAYVEDFGATASALLKTGDACRLPASSSLSPHTHALCCCAAAMDTFEKVAGRYNAEVVVSKRKVLRTKVCDELFVLFQSQMKHATKQTVTRFNSEVQKAIGKSDEPSPNFFNVMQTARANAVKLFSKLYEGQLLHRAH